MKISNIATQSRIWLFYSLGNLAVNYFKENQNNKIRVMVSYKLEFYQSTFLDTHKLLIVTPFVSQTYSPIPEFSNINDDIILFYVCS